jgi:hypothetical protein
MHTGTLLNHFAEGGDLEVLNWGTQTRPVNNVSVKVSKVSFFIDQVIDKEIK